VRGQTKKEAPKPLPPEIVKAWRDAGAEVGWMKDVPPQAEGSYEYWAPWREKGEPGLCRRFGSTRKAGRADQVARSWGGVRPGPSLLAW